MLLVRNCYRNANKLHTLAARAEAARIHQFDGPSFRIRSVKLKLLQPTSIQWSETQLKHFGQNRRSALKDLFIRLRYRINNYFVFFGTVRVEDWFAVALFAITGILMVLGVYMEFSALHGVHDISRIPPKNKIPPKDP